MGGGDIPLRVSGDYPLGSYDFYGTVTDVGAVTGMVDVTITFEALPDITALELLTSIDGTDWKAGTGTIDAGYTDYINPKYEFQYLDAGTYTVTKTLADGYYGFFLDETTVPSTFFTYWASRGVISGATGWQGIMWDIINGNLPMFFLVVDGSDYSLIDGMQYIASFGAIKSPLRVSGDYPLGTYNFTGTVEDLHYGLGEEEVTISFERLNLYYIPLLNK
jgi:hypothetical protein